MRRYLLDSAMQIRRSGARLGTAIPVAAEYLGGILYSSSWQTNLPTAERIFRKLHLWPFELAAARIYARLYAELRQNGIRMQPIDLMIASIALTVPNCTVVTCDSDFSRVPGLKIENWE